MTHPKAVNAIYGPNPKCSKASWYDLTRATVSLQTLRVKALHEQRRRTWSPAFSDKAIRVYEERIKKYRNQLIAQIDTFDGQPVDVTKWFMLYNFDITGDLVYGTSFNMLDTGEEHWAVKLMNNCLTPVSWQFAPWFFRLMAAIPGLMRSWWRWLSYCSRILDERMSVKPPPPNIFGDLDKMTKLGKTC